MTRTPEGIAYIPGCIARRPEPFGLADSDRTSG